MLSKQDQFSLLDYCISFIPVVSVVILSLLRKRKERLVREAMIAAYYDVEFIRINYLPEHCKPMVPFVFHSACNFFREAQDCLRAGRYDRAIELAKNASDIVRCMRSHVVCRSSPLPVPPPPRSITEHDGFVWMGQAKAEG